MDEIMEMEYPNIVDYLSLWPHQRDAVEAMHNYINNAYENITDGSALVHMPTGSGKTGVIATLARCLPEVQCVLILTTRVAIRRQLTWNINNRFF